MPHETKKKVKARIMGAEQARDFLRSRLAPGYNRQALFHRCFFLFCSKLELVREQDERQQRIKPQAGRGKERVTLQPVVAHPPGPQA